MSDPNGLLHYRVKSLEDWQARIETLRPDVLVDRVEGQRVALGELRDEVRSLRRALWQFSLTIAGSATIFSLTIFLAFR